MASRLRTNSGTKISFFAFQDIITSVTGILILVTLILSLHLNDAAPLLPSPQYVPNKQQLEDIEKENHSLQETLDTVAGAPDAHRLREDIAEAQRQVDEARARIANRESTRTPVPDYGRQELENQIRTNESRAAQSSRAKDAAQARLEEIQRQVRDQLVLIPAADNSGRKPVLVVVSAARMTCERTVEGGDRIELGGGNLPSKFAEAMKSWNVGSEFIVFYVRPSGIETFNDISQQARAAGFKVGYDAVEEGKEVILKPPSAP